MDQQLLNERLMAVENQAIAISKLQLPLREYQEKGANYLITFRRAVLNYSIGLGKTATAIAACKTIMEREPGGRFLIVCPSSNKFTVWRNELEKFLGPGTATIVDGSYEKRIPLYATQTPFVVTSYELLRRQEDLQAIIGQDWKGAVFDEITRLKNRKAQTYKAACNLQKYRYLFGLTGCSMENSVEEIFAITSVLNPFVFPKWTDFKNKFLIADLQQIHVRGGGTRWVEKITGAKNLDFLKEQLKPVFYIKARQDTGTSFHGCQNVLYEVEPTASQENAFQAIAEQAKEEEKGIFPVLIALKQACNHPELAGYPGDSAKLAELLEVLSEMGEKVIIFSQYVETLKLLERILVVLGRPLVMVTGEDGSQEKDAKIKQFQALPEGAILLSSDCLTYGTNLQFCRILINYDMLWNPMAMEQRAGRVDRLGQERDVVIINFKVKNSIEERVWQVLTEKKELINKLIGIEFGKFDVADSEFVKWLIG